MRIIKTKISSGINIEAAVGAAKIPFYLEIRIYSNDRIFMVCII